jgi:hypothetical protein
MRDHLHVAASRFALVSVLALVVACSTSRRPSAEPVAATSDSALRALQARGADPRGMGVDQRTSAHRFDALADGGRIELQQPAGDSADVETIRRHLRAVAAAFQAGDFDTPEFVHAQRVPGTDVMASRRATIRYDYADLPRGGEVRITTADPAALEAVHAFIAFQREEHHAKGEGHAGHMSH